MSCQIRIAQQKDLVDLVELMHEFYKEVGSLFNKESSREAFKKLLSDKNLGRVWIFEKDDCSIGYMVLTVGFSIEYGGKDAFLDDLFIKENFRGAGLGKQALEIFFKECHMLEVRAVHVEVGPANIHAKKLYKRVGFKDNNRQLFTKRRTDESFRH